MVVVIDIRTCDAYRRSVGSRDRASGGIVLPFVEARKPAAALSGRDGCQQALGGATSSTGGKGWFANSAGTDVAAY